MSEVFEAKEPTAAEHALRLTTDYTSHVIDRTPSEIVDIYATFYKGILAALKGTDPSWSELKEQGKI